MSKSGGAAPRGQSGSAKASWIFGSLLLAVLVVVLFVLPEPTAFQRDIARFLMALVAGFLGYFFMGGVVFKGAMAGQAVGAGGGCALFILVAFVVTPFDLKTGIADVAPGLLPADPNVAEAQRTLAQDGFYTGPVTGKANSQTRRAIREFQASKHMKVDGFWADATTRVPPMKIPKPPSRPP